MEIQNLEKELELAEIVLAQGKENMQSAHKEMKKVEQKKKELGSDDEPKPNGQMILSVMQYQKVELKDPPAPKFHCEFLPSSVCPRAPTGTAVYEAGQILIVNPITTLDFKIKIVPYTKDESQKLYCLVNSKDFINVPKAVERWYDLECQGSGEQSDGQELKVGDLVTTQFGNGEVAEIKPHHIVVKTTDWKIAGGKPATLYLQHSVVNKSVPEATAEVEEEKIEVGDIVFTQFGKGEVEEVREDHVVVKTIDWKIAGAKPATLYLRPSTVSKTDLDKGKNKGRVHLVLRYMSPDPTEKEMQAAKSKYQMATAQKTASEKQVAELKKNLRKKKNLAQKKDAKKAAEKETASTEQEQAPTVLGKLASPFKALYNNREILWKMKNILIFAGGVAIMHFRGDDLAV